MTARAEINRSMLSPMYRRWHHCRKEPSCHWRFLLAIFFSLLSSDLAAEQPAARVALVIDDVGNSASDREVIALPGPVTLSFLPFTPHSRHLARLAHESGKEVMLHMPMEAKAGNRLGHGALTNEMSQSELQSMLIKALQSLPHVAGVNNHMGSDLTESLPHMAWTMRLLRYYPLYFIDSRTSVNTCAEDVALATGVPALRRHVFLDNLQDQAAISRQFDQLIKLALRQGYAVGIAHPYPETLSLLQQRLPELTALGIELVPASALIDDENWAAREKIGTAPLAVRLPDTDITGAADSNGLAL
ncbi:divergent polysaccharide deacetylase family protein [Corallincola luteus]|nr:divergent polysaccharide deacetylase family protein [Corallincola luteus]